MYSRKQFILLAARHCSDFVKKCQSFLSFIEKESCIEPDNSIPESLFLEVMRLGLDPGTMNTIQLSDTVRHFKD